MVVGLLMVGAGTAAGAFGALLGLGGGVLIVPLLTLGFGLPLREAVGVSLICVIMTSSAAAGVYLERHVANLRLGMTLELFTAIGALVGGSIAFLLDERLLALLFAILLAYVAVSMLRGPRDQAAAPEPELTSETDFGPRETVDPVADPHVRAPAAGDGAVTPLDQATRGLAAVAADLSGPGYQVRNMGRGIAGATGAGVLSALLGVGGGIVKVPLMHLAMGVPLKTATATSNLMIGITGASSAVIYLIRGGIDPYVAGPTALGVFVGASVASRVAHRVPQRWLRTLFVVVLAYTAVQMLIRAING
jgi:uncharacterized membrane protein YfcA